MERIKDDDGTKAWAGLVGKGRSARLPIGGHWPCARVDKPGPITTTVHLGGKGASRGPRGVRGSVSWSCVWSEVCVGRIGCMHGRRCVRGPPPLAILQRMQARARVAGSPCLREPKSLVPRAGCLLDEPDACCSR